MSRPTVIYWPPSGVLSDADLSATIASVQDVTNGSDVLLKANTQGSPFSSPYKSFLYANIVRDPSFASTNIVRSIKIKYTSANPVTFTIRGKGCSVDGSSNPKEIIQEISEDIAGIAGAALIVQSTKIYSQIDSITVTGSDVTNLSVGYGSFGIAGYINTDYNKESVQALSNSVSLQFLPGVGVTRLSGAVWFSLNKIENTTMVGTMTTYGFINGTNVLPANTFIPAFPLIAAGIVNAVEPAETGMSTIWATVTNSFTDSMFFTFLQQGIR